MPLATEVSSISTSLFSPCHSAYTPPVPTHMLPTLMYVAKRNQLRAAINSLAQKSQSRDLIYGSSVGQPPIYAGQAVCATVSDILRPKVVILGVHTHI